MKLEDIIKKYIDAAIKHGNATEKGNLGWSINSMTF